MSSKIEITVYAAHLRSDLDGQEMEEYADAYGEALEEALEAEWPQADVTVNVRHNVSGVGGGTYAETDGEQDKELEIDVTYFEETFFEAFDGGEE